MRPFVAALLALTLTVPAFSNPSHRYDPVRDARAEIAQIERLTHQVHDPRLRRQLTTHVANAQYALDQVRQVRPGPRPVGRQACPVDALRAADAHTLVQRERWDSDRLAAVERIGRTACLTTDEARSIVSLFTWDDAKSRALIALYPAVVDKARYPIAFDVLTWSTSRDQVAAALGI